MIRLLKTDQSKVELKCERCKNFIKKGDYFLRGVEFDQSWLKSYGRRIVLDMKCGVKEADVLDSLRINQQLNKQLA